MVKGPLADRLEYAILQIVMGFSDCTQQASCPEWATPVRTLVPDLAEQPALKAAFTRLWNRGYIRLFKDGLEYTGNEPDSFFYTGPFESTITDEGRSYWDGVRGDDKSCRAHIGFV